MDIRGTAYVVEPSKPFPTNGVSGVKVVGGDLRAR